MMKDGRVTTSPGSSPSGQAASHLAGKAAAIPRAAKRPRPEVVMADYLAAYRAANGRDADIRLIYANGWVLFRAPNSYISFDRKRMREVVEMTMRLNARAAQAMEAQRGETAGLAAKPDSAVGSADAPSSLPHPRSRSPEPNVERET